MAILCGPALIEVRGEEAAAESKFPTFDKVVKDAKKIDGLFTLYRNDKEEQLFLEIRQDQYDKDLIVPISVARGAGGMVLGGDTLNFGNQWVLSFRRAGDRILVVRRNVQITAKSGTPQADAVKTSYNDSIILALPIRAEQPGGSAVLVDAADLFMTDLADMGLQPDRARSTWGKVKGFEGNVEIEVNAVLPFHFGGYYSLFGFSTGVPDMRGMQVVMHYGLSLLPSDNGYQTRLADDRVGHFLSVLTDYSSDAQKSASVHYVTRWRLEKADASADKSPPKEPIIFWIEKSVPREYRPYVKAGILEWNKAFDKIGFIDAIQVRDQQPGDDFDPEDIRYNTFRWITTSSAFAMGPSRTNPLTGQILDADILFDEAMVRYWRQEYLLMSGLPKSMELLRQGDRQAWFKFHAGDIPGLMQMEPAINRLFVGPNGFALPVPPQNSTDNGTGAALSDVPWRLGSKLASGRRSCSLGPGMTRQLGLLSAILSIQGTIPPGAKVPEEFIGQALKEVTMHEVGHTLGLRHNFKASGMLSLDACSDTAVTGEKGMAGSVMDYLPANIALKGQKQGDYFSRTIGPYDYWAIEYAYRPISGDEQAELAKIASRVAEPDLAFGTDEDLYGNPDPRINLYDLGDPLDYAKQRIQLVEDNLKDLADHVVAEGDGWQRAREAFGLLLSELASASYLSAQYIGGEYTHRDHRGDPNARAPYEPIQVAKQRDAIALLTKHVLSDESFKFPPELLRKLAPEYLSDGFYFSSSSEYPVFQQIAGIQRIVLSQFLNGSVLQRLQNIELHASADQEVLKLPEVFDVLTTAVWSELPKVDDPSREGPLQISTIRRNLQREHLKRLSSLVLGPRQSYGSFSDYLFLFSDYGYGSAPADARSLAKRHLQSIQERIQKAIAPGASQTPDAYSSAHLSELNDQITKVLSASLQQNEP